MPSGMIRTTMFASGWVALKRLVTHWLTPIDERLLSVWAARSGLSAPFPGAAVVVALRLIN